MSIEAVRAVMIGSKAKGVARCLMFVLAEHHSADAPVSWPGKGRLARCMWCHPDSVDAAIERCVALGEIEVTLRPGKSSLYRILLPMEQPKRARRGEGPGVAEDWGNEVYPGESTSMSKSTSRNAEAAGALHGVHTVHSVHSSSGEAGFTVESQQGENFTSQCVAERGEVFRGRVGEISAPAGGDFRSTPGSDSLTNPLNHDEKENKNPGAQGCARENDFSSSFPEEVKHHTGSGIEDGKDVHAPVHAAHSAPDAPAAVLEPSGKVMRGLGNPRSRCTPPPGVLWRRTERSRADEQAKVHHRGQSTQQQQPSAMAPNGFSKSRFSVPGTPRAASTFDIPFVPAPRKAEPAGWREWFVGEYPRAHMPPNWDAVPFTQKQEFRAFFEGQAS